MAWPGLDLKGRLRTFPPSRAVDVNIGIGTVLQNLDGAIMATAEARYGRFLVFSDLVARTSRSQAFGYPANVGLESGAVIATAMADTGSSNASVQPGSAGRRPPFRRTNTIDVQTLPLSISFGKRAKLGGWCRRGESDLHLTDKWFMTVIGLGGGISSNYEWDVFGGVGYRFNERLGAFAGYRALKVDYQSGDFIYDALQHGPVLGAQVRFLIRSAISAADHRREDEMRLPDAGSFMACRRSVRPSRSAATSS